jgi:hypothetical protein
MKRILFFMVALSLILGSCSESPKSDQSTGLDTTAVNTIKVKKVNIKAQSTGKFLSCDGHKYQKIIGDRDNASEWELFTLTELGGNKVSLKAYNGKFVCADQKKDNILIANRTDRSDWETFTMEKQKDDKVAFKASNNKYVCCDPKLEGILAATRDTIGDWELFTIIYK